jgi:competence protein ComEC
MKRNTRNFVLGVLVVLFSLNILAWIAVFDLSKPQFLEVDFFDVGQGDAIFIETPSRQQILIDGGPDSKILEKLGKEMPFYDRTIDLVILTHPERDHLMGLLEVLKKYKVENILWTGIVRDTAEFKEWLKLIKKEKANIFITRAGQRIIFSMSPDLVDRYIEIFYPFENLEGQLFKDSNNTSIVAKLNFGENSFLFTGDAYQSVEEELIIRENSCSNSCKFATLDSDILKIAHHGSKTSSSEEFLKAVLPELAIISVGKNKDLLPDCDNKERNYYGHPSCEVLERLKNFGINILRTDLDGDIKIFSDGENLKIKN